MVVHELSQPPVADLPTKDSPEYVRISMASAIALRMCSGRFSRDFRFGGINLLLSYEQGCRSDCGYCGLARTRPGSYADKSFIRVRVAACANRRTGGADGPVRTGPDPALHLDGHPWPRVPGYLRYPRRITERVRTPVSVLVAPPTLTRERLDNFRSIGVDMIGIGLDAVTEELFKSTRTDVPAGGLKWEKYWDVVTDAREIFGPWKVNVHTLVGLGESDQDLVSLFVALRDRQIFSYLFCFNPEPGSRMAAHPQPSLRRWRRVQLARYLVEAEDYGLEQFGFDAGGAIIRLRAARSAIEAVVADGRGVHDQRLPGRER